MPKFYVPYRIAKFDTPNLSRINMLFKSIEGQLQLVPNDVFEYTKTITLSASHCVEGFGTSSAENYGSYIQSSSNTNPCTVYGSLILPNGATITQLKVYWNRTDAAATGDCDLIQCDFSASETVMATADSDASTGDHSVTDTSITNPILDYDTYMYYIKVVLDPNDAKADVKFYSAVISYTLSV
jgi:hypothetical protein